jgi:hypothetical protein
MSCPDIDVSAALSIMPSTISAHPFIFIVSALTLISGRGT